jgi:hypothetical protein
MSDDRLAHFLDGGFDPDPPTEFVSVQQQLASDSLWLEPPADLQESIVTEITSQRPVRERPTQLPRHRTARRRTWQPWAAGVGITAVAAAIALVVVIAIPRGDINQLRMQGTELATSASAIATVVSTTSGEDITLNIHGLQPAPEEHYYQGWVRTGPEPDDNAVTIGTFHMRGGDDEVTLWSGVPIEDFPVLTVTLEPDDGDPASSGDVVLRGRLGEDPAP